MRKKLSIHDYYNLDTEEKKEYILEIMELEAFWVMGYVKNTRKENSFYFIENLINPYTTLSLNWNVFSDIALNNKLKFDIHHKNEKIKDGTLVLAKITLDSNEENLSKKGVLFKTFHKEVKVIESLDKVAELIEKTDMNLPLIALTSPLYYERTEKEFDELTNIVRKVAEKERQTIKELKELENRKLEEKLEEIILKEKKFESEYKIFAEKIKKINELGFALELQKTKSEKDQLTKFELPNNNELVLLIKEQLKLRGFYYSIDLLRQILLSLLTGEMIILIGPSGTGKTSIVRQLADVIDADYEIMPVQPSWTDKQDLIGFYNPIRKLFVPSPFLDCLIKAKDNPDKLFFICLDEMNLAQIEYYLADMLSIREVPGEKLRLYSDLEYEQNISEIRWFVQNILKSEKNIEEAMSDKNIDTMMHFEMISRYKNIQRYPAKLEIPSNIRILGTMNVDGAVQSISPKIIDRSFIIPVMKQSIDEETYSKKSIGRYSLNPNDYKSKSNSNDSLLLQSELISIQKELKKFNIEFNNRFEKQLKSYHQIAQKFDISEQEQVDDLVLLKFLPRIHNTFEDVEINNLIEKIKLEIGESSQTLKKIEDMKSQIKDIGLLSYWS
ncbi:AAA family ATPase [Exiguobacterium sp. s193]|uniref:AAA family ATPase n=1 Tax=Exiguobacterium sp. s193 TaxID=2751207 RepID=UPI001BE8971F|nr:AAA family ATPase [Exiguobacterium sp. s193]